MPVTKVSSIHIYPIKSIAGITLPEASVEEIGLAFDRRFIVSDLSGEFITARTEPKLCLVKATLLAQGIELLAPNMPKLTLLYDEFNDEYNEVSVWGDVVAGQLCSNKANQWFSEYLQRPYKLLFFGDHSLRERKPNTNNARKLAFSDGYPILLISQASLDNLNEKLLSKQQSSISMAQFRPNIVVDNCLPFAEDGWQHISIGEVEFKVSKPCERCIFTTINPSSGEVNAQQEPLRTLKSYRQSQNGEVLFGQNLIALNSGNIYQGDKLTVLGKKSPPIFEVNNPVDKTQASQVDNQNNNVIATSKKKFSVFFEKWNKTFQSSSPKGNDKAKTILENGEEAGLILPYSCRAGMCGRCKAKLISGEVVKSSTDGLTEQERKEGYILCCNTVAISDVVIKHD